MSAERENFRYNGDSYFDRFGLGKEEKIFNKKDLFLNILNEDKKSKLTDALITASILAGLDTRSAETERLRARISYLEGQTIQTQSQLDVANGKVLQLERKNKVLMEMAGNLAEEATHWRTEAERLSQSQTDSLDPQGYCKALGANPQVLKSLNQEEADKYLKSLRNAQAHVSHPDRTSGDTETMKAVNEAYEFLKNPSNRATYGRS